MKVLGKGSPVQRDKTKPRSRCRDWELSVWVEDDYGDKSRRTRRFHGTYTQALEALEDFKRELNAEIVTCDSPFADYATEWHRRRAESGMLAKRTMDNEPMRLRAAAMHLKKPLNEITRQDIERCYSALLDGDSPSGRKWQPKSVECLHKTLSTLFNQAVRDGDLVRAPTYGAKRPTVPEKVRAVPHGGDLRDFERMLSAFDPHHLALILAVSCGLRRSEIVQLRWTDYTDGWLTVSRAAEEDGSPKPTKNVHVRRVPVPTETKRILDYLMGNLSRRELEGPLIGAEIRPKVLTRWWSRNRGKFGMDGTRLHDLRHAYATRLAESGVHPRIMMELGGWESIDVCMRIYSHVNEDTLRSAVEEAFGT